MFILLTAVGLLVPLYSEMELRLYEAYRRVHATEAAWNGMKLHVAQQLTAGQQTIEGITYKWQLTDQQICVQYEGLSEVEELCIEPS